MVCRAEAQIVRDERNIEEEAKFLLLAETPEGKAAEHPDKIEDDKTVLPPLG